MTESHQTIYQSLLLCLSVSLSHSLSTYTIIHPIWWANCSQKKKEQTPNTSKSPLVQGLPVISSHCHWLAPSSTTMNTHLQVACWEIQVAIHCYLSFFLFVLGTYGSHSIHWKRFIWFPPPILQIFQQDKSNGNHMKFYIMDLGATLLGETEILPFWRSDLKVFWDPELSKIWLLQGSSCAPHPKEAHGWFPYVKNWASFFNSQHKIHMVKGNRKKVEVWRRRRRNLGMFNKPLKQKLLQQRTQSHATELHSSQVQKQTLQPDPPPHQLYSSPHWFA
jgi:hypothetical protein